VDVLQTQRCAELCVYTGKELWKEEDKKKGTRKEIRI
jgi:hypothetical protein